MATFVRRPRYQSVISFIAGCGLLMGSNLALAVEAAKPTTVALTTTVHAYTHVYKHVVGTNNTELRLLAGDFELAKLHVREREQSLRVPRKRFAKFIGSARFEYDLIVLDCNPSTSFLTRAALEASTHLVIPIRPDRYSLLGAEMLFEFMDFLPTLVELPVRMLLLNGLGGTPTPSEATVANEVRSNLRLGPMTLVADVPQSDVLKARPDFAGVAVDRQVPYSANIAHRLGQVADEIATKLGIM